MHQNFRIRLPSFYTPDTGCNAFLRTTRTNYGYIDAGYNVFTFCWNSKIPHDRQLLQLQIAAVAVAAVVVVFVAVLLYAAAALAAVLHPKKRQWLLNVAAMMWKQFYLLLLL